ncbi:MAG: DUF1743 domain-containing protein [Thermoplasmatales archaeon]|nr:DUF1743 domain-containing protein [Thermoplasmatales archaeon]
MPTILRPEEVRAKYGPMFCRAFFTMVDEENGIAQIIEQCASKGPSEWDAVNRKRAGGILRDVRVEGTTLITDVEIGEKPISFGAVSEMMGGQGISMLRVEGDRVRTRWSGLAGASVGIGACIPQCEDVIETVYPPGFKMGGAHSAEVEIVTPKKTRVIIGVDDTDTPVAGATWVTTMKMGRECPVGRLLDHKIIQLNPRAPDKTTNCCSTAVSFAVKPSEKDALVGFCKDYLAENTLSDETVMAVFEGLRIPGPLAEWGWNAKKVLYTVREADEVAAANGVGVHRITGEKGAIGAVAAIGCFDMGLRAAGVEEDFD